MLFNALGRLRAALLDRVSGELALRLRCGLMGVALLTVGCRERFVDVPPGDSYVIVNDAPVHVRRVGESGPSVVLVSALGGDVDDWSSVSDALGAFARVLAYDRPGLGSSAPGLGPRSAGAMAEELDSLLERSGLPAPYVLCGHSLGGSIVQVYASRHPEDVCGLVLVDPSIESFFRTAEELGLSDVRPPDTEGWPDGPREELAAWDVTLAEMRECTVPAVPCAVLISVKHDMAPVSENLWLASQIEWAHSHPPATYEIDRDHGHYLQFENPGMVIEAVRRVAAACVTSRH